MEPEGSLPFSEHVTGSYSNTSSKNCL